MMILDSGLLFLGHPVYAPYSLQRCWRLFIQFFINISHQNKTEMQWISICMYSMLCKSL